MTDAEKLQALEAYFALMSMNGGVRVYQTTRQLGIFEKIQQGIVTTDDIARACGLQARPTQLALDALCSLKLLICRNGAYQLTAVMQFLSGSYQALSDEYWDHLPALLKTGVPMARMDDPKESEKQYQYQARALAWMMRPAAERAAAMLKIGTERTGFHILDIGAGSAVWSLTFASKDGSTRVTAVDWPAVLTIATESAEALGLRDRFIALPGNYHEVDLPPDTYDLAIVGNVTHLETPEGNRALFARIHRSLRTHGELVIFDIFSGQEAGALARALYALGLALRTRQGQVYSYDDLRGFLVATHFVAPALYPIAVPPYTIGMLVAKRGT